MTLLRIERLSAGIHGIDVLREVTLNVEGGQILGVIGESGSGKSLTALSIMRLLPEGMKAVGKIMLEGRDLMRLSEQQMCAVRGGEIGMVFQEPMTALNPL